MTCKECKYYKETYPNKGYCRLWKEYMKEYETCEDWEEEWQGIKTQFKQR